MMKNYQGTTARGNKTYGKGGGTEGGREDEREGGRMRGRERGKGRERGQQVRRCRRGAAKRKTVRHDREKRKEGR